MKPVLFVIASMAALFFGGCADDLSPESVDRAPAPYAPDPMGHIPATTEAGRPGT